MLNIIKSIGIVGCILFLTTLTGCGFDKDSQEMKKLEKEIEQGKAVFRDYESLGKIYFKKERYEDTINCMTSLLEKYNKSEPVIKRAFKEYSYDAYRLRGKSKYLLGQQEDAKEDLAKGNSESYDYYQLGELYFKKQNYNEVVNCVNKIKPEDIGIGAYYLRGRALYFLGDKEEGAKDLRKAGGGGWSAAVAFMREHQIEWGGKEKENYDRMVRNASGYNARRGKNFPERDQVFNALRDDIENSNISWAEKQKAKVKLHDDMYKE